MNKPDSHGEIKYCLCVRKSMEAKERQALSIGDRHGTKIIHVFDENVWVVILTLKLLLWERL